MEGSFISFGIIAAYFFLFFFVRGWCADEEKREEGRQSGSGKRGQEERFRKD